MFIHLFIYVKLDYLEEFNDSDDNDEEEGDEGKGEEEDDEEEEGDDEDHSIGENDVSESDSVTDYNESLKRNMKRSSTKVSHKETRVASKNTGTKRAKKA